jgi:hypothetical protein
MSERKRYLLAYSGLEEQQAVNALQESCKREGIQDAIIGAVRYGSASVFELSLPVSVPPLSVQAVLERAYRRHSRPDMRIGFHLATYDEIPEAQGAVFEQDAPITNSIRSRAVYSIS